MFNVRIYIIWLNQNIMVLKRLKWIIKWLYHYNVWNKKDSMKEMHNNYVSDW